MFSEATSFNGDVSDWDTSWANDFVSQRMHGDVPESEQHPFVYYMFVFAF